MNQRADALVIGAGVAGISAAMHLADAGLRVTLLEQRKLLGGRAGSFVHELGPRRLLDSSPHVLMGCCTELLELYRRLGVSHLIRFDDPIEFVDIDGRRARMQANLLPAPLHLGLALAGFELLTIRQRTQVARALFAMFMSGRAGREQREPMTFGAYLRSLGQSEETIRAWWEVVCISALNDNCDKVSAKYGMQVFQQAFFGEADAYRVGYARTPLSELYTNLAGVDVRTSSSVRSLLHEDGEVRGVQLVSGETIEARETVLATSPGAALALLRPIMHLDPQFARIEKLRFRPILGAHLLYDRAVPLHHPVALVGTQLHWVFPDENRPELLHGVVSGADVLEGLHRELPAIFDREIKTVLPHMGECRLVDHLIVTESRATFRPLPGTDAIRPGQKTAVPGLTLAGDYTRTDWPATMEGAARSGHLAAAVVLDRKRRA